MNVHENEIRNLAVIVGAESRRPGGDALVAVGARLDALADTVGSESDVNLLAGEQVVVVVGGKRVAVSACEDRDGHAYLQIGGLGCDLEGEQPGMYYPVDRPDEDTASGTERAER